MKGAPVDGPALACLPDVIKIAVDLLSVFPLGIQVQYVLLAVKHKGWKGVYGRGQQAVLVLVQKLYLQRQARHPPLKVADSMQKQ